VLTKYYGSSAVTPGNKSIKVAAADGQRLPADVVPCCIHKTFRRFPPQNDSDVIEGIRFFTTNEERPVLNYPKLHRENGTAKNAKENTNGWFKPTVRMFKNARRALVDANFFAWDVAPSYFVECLLFNAPNNLFGPTHQQTMTNVLNWAAIHADYEKMVCQNQRLWLFGSTPEQWQIPKAKELVSGLIDLWNEWND
jgi:hypothetical protein